MKICSHLSPDSVSGVTHPCLLDAVQEMKEKMCGHPMSVTITQANPYERRFTASQRVAEYNTKVSAIK